MSVGQPWSPTFGKYRGVDIEDIPDSYLRWIAEAEPRSASADDIKRVSEELEWRELHNAHVLND